MAQETASAHEPERGPDSAPTPRVPRRVSPRAVALAVLSLALLVVLPAWVDERLAGPERVLSSVTLAHSSIARSTREALEPKLKEHARALLARRLVVRISGKRFEVEPAALGLRIDEARSVDNALRTGREGGFFSRVAQYWQRLRSAREVSLAGTLDAQALAVSLESWEAQSLSDRPFQGGIEVRDSVVKELAPKGGRRINKALAERALLAAVLAPERRDLELTLEAVNAPLLPDAASSAAAEARSLVQAPLALKATETAFTLTLSPAELGSVLSTERDGARLRLVFIPDRLSTLLEPARASVELEPVDAKLDVSATGAISVVPSRPGRRIELDAVPKALLAAAKSPTRDAELPIVHRPEPALGTAAAEALGVKGLVSSFTTRHPCCEKRVTNIHRIADLLDGQIVLPGQTVSLNTLVGPRTEKRGFVPAPTIEEGEMVDSVGGGISQFATTFFNALFHGGYDIIERQPHTYWFPRYPMGHEATLSWPKPDIIFRNDTAAGLLIKASYTGTTVTVKLYGDNGGRKVRAEVSGRQNVVPAPLEILPNPRVAADKEQVKEPGSVGWSVIVSRVMTFADGTKKEERRRVTYKARPRRIEIHPCRLPEGEKGYTGEPCPIPEGEEASTAPALP